jgi:hypothetical protein
MNLVSQKEITELADEINKFVLKQIEISSCQEDDNLDTVDLKYAEAILTYRLTRDIKMFFETDNKVFLFFSKELEKKFELEILSSKQSKIRRQQLTTMLLFNFTPMTN